MAILVLFCQRVVLFLLRAGLVLGDVPVEGTDCDWILRLQGARLQERGAGAPAWFFLFLPLWRRSPS